MDEATMREALEHDEKRKAIEAVGRVEAQIAQGVPYYDSREASMLAAQGQVPPAVLKRLDEVLKETAAQTQMLLEARAKEVADEREETTRLKGVCDDLFKERSKWHAGIEKEAAHLQSLFDHDLARLTAEKDQRIAALEADKAKLREALESDDLYCDCPDCTCPGALGEGSCGGAVVHPPCKRRSALAATVKETK